MMVKNSHKRLSHTSIALMVPLVRTPKCVHEAFIYENHTQKYIIISQYTTVMVCVVKNVETAL